ncbi:GNAT family N-acetyltransferase [Oceanobacillus massiliensis]|uniref:GNAT family N-acetyltransferase n=1 Tax=Oceanobacillus massiliensis TaxID=1465765 RepID=UPI0030178199
MAIRFYQPGDELKISELFQKVFHKEQSEKVWEWKYLKNPTESNPWVLVYEEDGHILGHISLWVHTAFVNGETSKIASRVDTMVDPDARGKGIYKKLNQRMLMEAKKSNIIYLYGFPAPKAKELLLRFTDGHYIADISRYMKILNPSKVISSRIPFFPTVPAMDKAYLKWMLKKVEPESLNGLVMSEVDYCDEDFDQLAERLNQITPVIVKRDSDYLNWRYINHPVNNYTILAARLNDKLVGFIVVKMEKRNLSNGRILEIGYIIDYIGESEDVLIGLGKYAMQYLKNTDMIQAWSLSNHKSDKLLKQLGFKVKDKPMPLVVHQVGENTTDYRKESDWWLLQGDVDSF